MNKIIVSTLLMLMSISLISCREGVTGGDIIQSFQGLSQYTVLSPTTVKLDWLQQDKYTEYQVFELGQAEPLEVSIFDTYTVTGLTANTEYVFKVIAVDANNEIFGGDKEIRIKTFPRFSGITAIEKDIDGNIVISWDFNNPVYKYHIFKHEFSKPTAATTNNWQNANVVLNANQQSYTFRDLEGSTQFYFQVHAEYKEGEFERPDQEITESTPTSFPDPVFDLPAVTIGSLPFASINPIENSDFNINNYTSQFFHGITPLSDPLVGDGTVSFLDSNNFGLGRIDNITLKVNYDDGTNSETFVKNGLSTYVKGQSPVLDQPVSPNGVIRGTAALGEAIASGDFNCDGFKDMAVSMPESAIGSLGVSANYAGAVYVYYSVTDPITNVTKLYTDIEPKINPVRLGKDPQIITFSDSSGFERFGYSMASGGNFNGDQLGGNDCDDLIVGAPFMRTGVNNEFRTGAAFVFFGNKNGLSASQTFSNIQDNIGTCDGLLEDSSCSPVRLWPDYSKWPSSLFPNGYDNIYRIGPNATSWSNSAIQFGHALNFVGDFNGDGYDDIAIGAPYAEFDGAAHTGAPGEKEFIQNAGYVAIYFGSKFGLGGDKVDNTSSAKFPFIKIFPPIPHADMLFGSSISNGGDVNGEHRVRQADGKYYGGSDFVVGAPGFYYPNPGSGAHALPSTYDAAIPIDGGWTTNYATEGLNEYGFSQNQSTVKTGAAFVYFGRDNENRPADSGSNIPSLSDFWKCKSRNTGDISTHYSCLSESDDFRILFPRNGNSTGFGSAVAILGGESYYDDDSTLPVPGIDPNGDGFAEIIVAASSGEPETSSSLNNSGVLWQFFGNRQKYFEHNFAGQGFSTASDQYLQGSATCANFSFETNDDAANKLHCRPTLLQSNSFRAGARLGLTNAAISVGQVTSDGLLDLAVGAPYDNANGTDAGAVLLFTSDKDRGLTSNYKKLYSTAGGNDTQLGYSVAIGNFDGDLNSSGDNFNDIAAGGPGDDTFRPGSGSAHLFLSNGFNISSFKSDSDKQIYDNLASPQLLGYHRSSIVGDVNGDGYDDAAGHVIRYDVKGNQVYDGVIFFGSEEHGLITSSACLADAARFVTDSDSSHCYPKTTRDTSVVREGVILPQLIAKFETQANLWANYARPAGDVNGDGFADVLFFDRNSRYELFFGSSAGLVNTDQPQWIPSSGNPQIVSDTSLVRQVSDLTSVTTVINRSVDNRDLTQFGDFNNDGFSDLVITNPYGSSAPLGEEWECLNLDPDDNITAEQCAEGVPVEFHGYAFVIYGSANGLQTPSLDTANFSFGTDIELSNPATFIDIYGTEAGTPACDLSGKCKVTLIRNPVFQKIDFGFERLGHRFSISSAVLDETNDTYDDLFLGASGFEDLGCYGSEDDDLIPFDYGRVYIYRGSSGGLVAADASKYYDASATGCPSTNDTSLGSTDPNSSENVVRALMPARYEDSNTTVSERKGLQFALNMTAAGDLNGDGFEDVLIGSNHEDIAGVASVGAMYAFYGPICANDNDPNYALTHAQLPSNLNKQATIDKFGTANVSCYTPVGSVGTSEKLPWQKFTIKGTSGTNDLYAGTSLTSGRKGQADFNGDGYDDVLIGAPYWDDDFNGISDVGRGVIFFGSDRGLFTDDVPSLNIIANDDGLLRPYSMQGPTFQGNSFFFANLPSLGDYNNDGTADVLVPSYWHDGIGTNKGINVGVFFIFY